MLEPAISVNPQKGAFGKRNLVSYAGLSLKIGIQPNISLCKTSTALDKGAPLGPVFDAQINSIYIFSPHSCVCGLWGYAILAGLVISEPDFWLT